jgi:hypothetical protein
LIMGHMATNVDKNQVFEFLRVTSLTSENAEAQRDAYWMIVYIYLKKTQSIDISDALCTRTSNLLKDVDLSKFTFNSGFLEYQTKKIDLAVFVPVAETEVSEKNEYFAPNNMHNLTNVSRQKSEMGLISDYPHYYDIKKEGDEEPYLFAIRESENGDFILSRKRNVFCLYGPNYIGSLKTNMLGTHFDLVNFGID